MGKTIEARPETIVLTPIAASTGAAQTVNYGTDQVPGGFYYLALLTKSSLTGTTTTITLTPFGDSTQTELVTLPIQLINQPGTNAALATLDAGAAEEIWLGTFSADATNPIAGVTMCPLPYGFRVAVANGTSVSGELLEATLLLQRVR